MSVRQQSKHELVAAQRARYQRASRTAKAQILDEFVAATGYHRKHALRLFREGPPAPRVGHGGRPRRYDAMVIGTLREVAALSDWLCGKRSWRNWCRRWKRRRPCTWTRRCGHGCSG